MATPDTRNGSGFDGPRVVATRGLALSGAAVASAADGLKPGVGLMISNSSAKSKYTLLGRRQRVRRATIPPNSELDAPKAL